MPKCICGRSFAQTKNTGLIGMWCPVHRVTRAVVIDIAPKMESGVKNG